MSTRITAHLGDPLFCFQSRTQWVNKGKSWFANCGVSSRDTICIDACGRVCTRGEHFPEDDSAYPITVYRTRPLVTERAST
jgi:hypothetical protein